MKTSTSKEEEKERNVFVIVEAFPRGIAHSHIHESACIDQLSKSFVVVYNLQINEKLILLFVYMSWLCSARYLCVYGFGHSPHGCILFADHFSFIQTHAFTTHRSSIRLLLLLFVCVCVFM